MVLRAAPGKAADRPLTLRPNGAGVTRRFVSLRLSNPFLATYRLFLVAALLFVVWIAAKAW